MGSGDSRQRRFEGEAEGPEVAEDDVAAGIDFTKLHFGRKVFRKIFISLHISYKMSTKNCIQKNT
jgi:hypothetical protein